VAATEAGRITSIVDLQGHVVQDVPGVAEDAWEPALSPDGTKVAYMTFDNTVGFCGGCSDTHHGTNPRIAMVGVDGTQSEFVTEFAGGIRNPMMPAISPDGTRVAFVGTRKGNTDIYIIDAPSTPLNTENLHLVRVTTDPGQDEFPAWTPDGRSIVYVSSGKTALDQNALSPTEEIWEVSAGGGTPVRLTSNDVPDNSPSVSPDGTKVAMFEGGRGIAILDLRTGRIRILGVGPDAWSPRWSPDGTRIAFLDFSIAAGQAPTWDPFHAPGGSLGPVSVEFPLGEVKILDVSTGAVANTHVQVLTEWSAVSWLPSGDALLVNRYLAGR
jgi:TolB protein